MRSRPKTARTGPRQEERRKVGWPAARDLTSFFAEQAQRSYRKTSWQLPVLCSQFVPRKATKTFS